MNKIKKMILILITIVFIMSIHVNASNTVYLDRGTMPNGDYIIGVGNSSEFSSRIVEGDLYVRRGAEFTFYGNMTVNGDVYILGNFYNQGTITVNGTVHFLNYYENDQLIMQALREIDGVLSGFIHGNLYNNGVIYYGNLVADSEIAFMDIPLVPVEVKTECEKGNHTPGTPANCTTNQTCTKCGIVLRKALGHYSDSKATCTQPERCKRCYEILSPATGHISNEWQITKLATGTETGIKQKKCKTCGAIIESMIIPKTNVKLNFSSLTLQLKKSTTALKVISISVGDNIKSWTSSNSKIVSVNKKTGKLTAKKTGKSIITVTTNTGAKATCTVTVQKGTIKTKKLSVKSKTVNLNKGKSYTISVTRNPITANDKINYKTSNKKIATVNSKGKIVAKKKGKATITVKAGKATVKIKVLVK